MASTASLSPCTTLNTPAGKPASWNSSKTSIEAEGSRSDGFSTKVLPQAMATGYIHIGTMAGKLKGVMPATTPSGWRSDQEFDLRADIAAVLALQEMRNAAGEIDHVDAAGELPCGVVMGLAVLPRDGVDDLVGVAIEQLLEAEHVLDALERRRRAPTDEQPSWRRRRRNSLPRRSRAAVRQSALRSRDCRRARSAARRR